MNNKLIKLLTAIATALCLIIAMEWLYAHFMQQSLLNSISAEPHQDYKTDQLPDIKLDSQPEENYVDLVARPLFIKGRKPVDEPTPDVAEVATKPVNFDWQLSGIYRVKKTVSALFSRTNAKVPKDNYRKVALGKTIDGWKLAVIDKDKVLLKSGSNEKELLLRKPKSKTIAAQRGNPPQSLPSPFNMPAPPPTNPAAPVPKPAPPTGMTPFGLPVPTADPLNETGDEAIEDTTDEDTNNEDTTEDTSEIIQ